jgi:hypothetical protein
MNVTCGPHRGRIRTYPAVWRHTWQSNLTGRAEIMSRIRFTSKAMTNPRQRCHRVCWLGTDSLLFMLTQCESLPQYYAWLALLLRVQNVPGSNFGQETSYTDWGYSWFYSVYRGKCRGSTSNQATATLFRILSDSLLTDHPILHVTWSELLTTKRGRFTYSDGLIQLMMGSCFVWKPSFYSEMERGVIK